MADIVIIIAEIVLRGELKKPKDALVEIEMEKNPILHLCQYST